MKDFTFDEVFRYIGLQGNRDQQYKQYAELLDSKQKGIPVVKELIGDQVSQNGLCEWDKKKAFINKHKHNVEFETISIVFEEPPPDGCEIVKDIPDPNSGGRNNRVIVFLAPDVFLVITTEGSGGLVRLISAREMSMGQVRRELHQSITSSTDAFWNAIADSLYSYDADGDVVDSVTSNPTADKFFNLCDLFCKGSISEDMVRGVMVYGFGLSYEHAGYVLEHWKNQKKQVDYLASQM